MNYLFFDIECATCRGGKGKICEFGYLLTDDNFNEIKREEILINPNSPFDWYTLKNLLHFTKNEYKSAPTYDSVYEKITEERSPQGVLCVSPFLDNIKIHLRNHPKNFYDKFELTRECKSSNMNKNFLKGNEKV